MLKALVLVILVAGLFCAPRMVAQSKSDMAEQKAAPTSEKTASIADKTKSMEKMAGDFNIYWDAKAGKLWLEIDKWGAEFLYQSSMPANGGRCGIRLRNRRCGDLLWPRRRASERWWTRRIFSCATRMAYRRRCGKRSRGIITWTPRDARCTCRERKVFR